MSTPDMTRFCVLTAPFLHHRLEFGLDSIAANGFSSIELWGASPHYCLDDYDETARSRRLNRINSMLAGRGLSMAVYHPEQIRQYPINIASPNAYIRRRSMDYMRRCIEDAAVFGAPIMMLTPGWAFVNDFTESDTLRSIQAVQELAVYAQPLGVRLAMEEQSAVVSLLCSSLARLKRIVQDAGIEACMDIPLALSNGGSIRDYFETFGQPAHVHLSDTGGAALGKGSLDIYGALSELDARGYAGKISLALWGAVHYPDPDTPLRLCRDWLSARYNEEARS